MKKYDCPFCSSNESVERISKEEVFEYKGHSKTFDGYVVYSCCACGEEYEEPNDNLLIEEEILNFRRRIDGLLSPSEIKKNRLALGFTQKDFAEALGVGEKNFARYENGSVTQSKAMDIALRLIFDDPSRALVVLCNRGLAAERVVNVQFQCHVNAAKTLTEPLRYNNIHDFKEIEEVAG